MPENTLYTTLEYTNVIPNMQSTSQFVPCIEIENTHEKKQAVCEGASKKKALLVMTLRGKWAALVMSFTLIRRTATGYHICLPCGLSRLSHDPQNSLGRE